VFERAADALMTCLIDSQYVEKLKVQGDNAVVLGNTKKYLKVKFADDVQYGSYYKLVVEVYVKGTRSDTYLMKLYPINAHSWQYMETNGVGTFRSSYSPEWPKRFPVLSARFDEIANFQEIGKFLL
jgi:hypothetical protein